MENDDAIKQLRETLRDGRAIKADTDAYSDYTDNDYAPGTTIQDARGTVRDSTSNGRFSEVSAKVIGDNKRGNDEKSFRVGQTTGRSSDDHFISPTSVSDGRRQSRPEQAIAGNFIATDGDTEQTRFASFITENPTASLRTIGEKLGFSKDKAKKLRDSWQAINPAQPKQKTPLPQLSKKELEEKKEILKSSLESDFQYIDEYLWSREEKAGKSSDRMPVWSDMDDEELERVCTVLTRWSQKNKAVAVTVNAINDSADYIAVGMAFGPRIKRTVDKVRETRVESTGKKRRQRVVDSKVV